MFTGHIEDFGPYRITTLALGELTIPQGTPMGGQVLPVQTFLITYPNGLLLFDTGLGAEHSDFDRLLTPVRQPLPEALAAANAQLSDVQMVINCHWHYDHAGANPLFPGRPVLVQAREYETAADLTWVIPERIDFPGAELHLLNGEERIAQGMRVVPTPGHTPGHQSLLIEDSEAPVIIAGQAAYTAAEFADPRREPARGLKTAWNQQEFLKSTDRLRALSPRRVYFSYDTDVSEPDS